LNKNFEISLTLPIIGSLFIDETMSSRADSLLKISFNLENVKDHLDINVYEPNSKKHLSKYNIKCKDSAMSSLVRNELTNIQDVVCEFRRPMPGKWTYEILNPHLQDVKVSIKAYALFNQYTDESNYYMNYYDRDDYKVDNKFSA
jgi:hypothetical protein